MKKCRSFRADLRHKLEIILRARGDWGQRGVSRASSRLGVTRHTLRKKFLGARLHIPLLFSPMSATPFHFRHHLGFLSLCPLTASPNTPPPFNVLTPLTF